MRSTESPTVCPFCGRRQEAATGAAGTAPSPGAVAICWKCTAVSLYDENLALRRPTAAETEELDADVRIARARAAMAAAATPYQAAAVIWGSS